MVMAASAVMRLQTVVSREVAMTDSAVVTVGTMSAGINENVIPDRALLRLNVRTFKDQVRTRVLVPPLERRSPLSNIGLAPIG